MVVASPQDHALLVPPPLAGLPVPPPLAPRWLIEGTPGSDVLLGTAGADDIYAYDGDDFVNARGGNDWVWGGRGKDTLLGGAGHDTLCGGQGDDSLEGGPGNDSLDGGDGDDILYGGTGLNTLTGGKGQDTFRIGALPGDKLLNYPGLGPVADGFSVITDFHIEQGDRLDFSPVLQRSPFTGLSSPQHLARYITFQQVGADTQVLITTPQGQTTLEALLRNVLATTMTADQLQFTLPQTPPTT